MDPIFTNCTISGPDPSDNSDPFPRSRCPGEWEWKIWGRTRIDFATPRFVLTHLWATAGGFSSVHYHRERANRFSVVQGVLDVWILRGWQFERVRLTVGNEYVVPSLVVHGFYAVTEAAAVEEYWADRHGACDVADIVRLTVGGCLQTTNPDAGDDVVRRLLREAVLHG